jgi:hypothetical protein
MGEFKNKNELRIARLGRSRSRATFVCITGSSAKSSTTEMISQILAGLGPVHTQVLKNCFSGCVETLRHIEPAHRTPPADAKGQCFLISVNSEEARAAKLGGKSKWMLGIGVACLIGAAASLGSAVWLARYGLDRPAPPQDVLQSESWR